MIEKLRAMSVRAYYLEEFEDTKGVIRKKSVTVPFPFNHNILYVYYFACKLYNYCDPCFVYSCKSMS